MNNRITGSSRPGRNLRCLSPQKLARLGERQLARHLDGLAMLIRSRYSDLPEKGLFTLLADPSCVRFPVRLRYDAVPLAAHQFAQPERDASSVLPAWFLCLHPGLRNRPADTARALLFYLPFMNFGDIVTESAAFRFGGAALGETAESCYAQLCSIADSLGAVPRQSGKPPRQQGPTIS